MLSSGLLGVDDAFELFNDINRPDNNIMHFSSLTREQQLKSVKEKINTFNPL